MEKHPPPTHDSTGRHYSTARPCWLCRHVGQQRQLSTDCWYHGTLTVIAQPQYGCSQWEKAPHPPMPGNGAGGD